MAERAERAAGPAVSDGVEGDAAATARRVVLADPLSDEGLAVLRESPGLEVVDLSAEERASLMHSLGGASALIVRSRTRVDAALLDAAEALEVVGRAGVGVDNIDVPAATRRGIAVLNAPGGNTRSTAELTWGLILAAARKIAAADRSIRAGRWERKALRGVQLHGKTLGVVGAGRIGSAVGARARAFGMRVLVHDPYLTPERAAELGLERTELDALLAESDVVTLHVPLTEVTRGMIGTAEIERMKAGAFLVNAARGGLVEQRALAEALGSGELAGAALDVYEMEPLPPEDPLRSAPNLVMTPHLGAATGEAQREVAVEIAAAVRDALLLGDYRTAVNAPYVEPGERRLLDPVMELGRRLGTLLAALTDGPCGKLEVRYGGSVRNVLRPLAAAALEGYLRPTVDRHLNVVNALSVASERGIQVGRVRLGEPPDYSNYVEVAAAFGSGEAEGGEASRSRAPRSGDPSSSPARTPEGDAVVGGALLGDGQHPRIVRIGEFHVDTVPDGVLLLVRNRDVPGVIGQVGTGLGAGKINIAEYHQARREAGGDALGVIRVDGRVPAEVLAVLRALAAVQEVRQVEFRR